MDSPIIPEAKKKEAILVTGEHFKQVLMKQELGRPSWERIVPSTSNGQRPYILPPPNLLRQRLQLHCKTATNLLALKGLLPSSCGDPVVDEAGAGGGSGAGSSSDHAADQVAPTKVLTAEAAEATLSASKEKLREKMPPEAVAEWEAAPRRLFDEAVVVYKFEVGDRVKYNGISASITSRRSVCGEPEYEMEKIEGAWACEP
jgi:hypothetical protein